MECRSAFTGPRRAAGRRMQFYERLSENQPDKAERHFHRKIKFLSATHALIPYLMPFPPQYCIQIKAPQ